MNIPHALANKLRLKVKQILEKANPPKSNNIKLERLVIRTLERNGNIFILHGDKGNVTVVIVKSEYT